MGKLTAQKVFVTGFIVRCEPLAKAHSKFQTVKFENSRLKICKRTLSPSRMIINLGRVVFYLVYEVDFVGCTKKNLAGIKITLGSVMTESTHTCCALTRLDPMISKVPSCTCEVGCPGGGSVTDWLYANPKKRDKMYSEEESIAL